MNNLLRKVQWEEMFPDELAAAVAEKPVCYMAYGLAEPHGPQNALGLDGIKAYELCRRAAQRHGGVVAPPFFWHVHETPRGMEWLSRQNAPQPFLTDVCPDLFLRFVTYQLRAVEAAGFRAALLITGHYGGVEEDIRRVAECYSRHRPLRTHACADWELINYGGFAGDHAGVCETSQLWSLRPDLVDLSRLPREGEGRIYASDVQAHGASRRTGDLIVQSQIAEIGKIVSKLLEEAEAQPPPQRISFDAAERIWKEIEAQRSRWYSSLSAEESSRYIREVLMPRNQAVRERSRTR